MIRPALGLCALIIAFGCSSQHEAPPAPRSSHLPEGQAVRVGSALVSVKTIARIAEQQALTPSAAASSAVADALFAEGARAGAGKSSAGAIERAALARSLLESLARDAVASGPPTSAEISDLVREHWVELDRPEAARTTHAIVVNDKPERDAAARALAGKLADALRGITIAEDFIKAANAFPKEGFETKAESLPFVTGDGRSFQRHDNVFVAQPAIFDPAYAHAAVALERPGQQSPVTKSSFGYHVILLEERAPSLAAPKDQLDALLGQEVFTRRAARARGELLEKLRRGSSVQLERAFDELTARVNAP